MRKLWLIVSLSILLSACNKTKPVANNVTANPSSSPVPTPIAIKIDKSNWQIYSNKLWSFKFPNHWVAVDCKSTDFVILGPALKPDQKIACDAEYPHPNEMIRMTRQSKKQMPEIPYTNSDVLKVEREPILIGGQQGVIQTIIYPDGSRNLDGIYVEHKSSIDKFHFAGTEARSYLIEILSTLKFK
jgi:hypothetical protein